MFLYNYFYPPEEENPSNENETTSSNQDTSPTKQDSSTTKTRTDETDNPGEFVDVQTPQSVSSQKVQPDDNEQKQTTPRTYADVVKAHVKEVLDDPELP